MLKADFFDADDSGKLRIDVNTFWRRSPHYVMAHEEWLKQSPTMRMQMRCSTAFLLRPGENFTIPMRLIPITFQFPLCKKSALSWELKRERSRRASALVFWVINLNCLRFLEQGKYVGIHLKQIIFLEKNPTSFAHCLTVKSAVLFYICQEVPTKKINYASHLALWYFACGSRRKKNEIRKKKCASFVRGRRFGVENN